MNCSRCGDERTDTARHRWCRACRAAYMRAWRPAHPLTDEQRRRDNARSYAGVYKRRGKLIPEPCATCGDPSAEMHHDDYARPLSVVWLCRMCHVEHHSTAA